MPPESRRTFRNGTLRAEPAEGDAESENLWHWNRHRSHAVVLDTRLSSCKERVSCTRVDKDVGKRGLETTEIVQEEGTVPR